jgi:hypothetical protein
MSNPQFTSGPWHVSEKQPTVVGNKEKAVCKCELDWNLGANERKANAALIAAAPEMYALLLDIVTDYQCMPNPAVMADKIEAVLKKARGEK